MSLDGRILANLHDNYQPEGEHTVSWEAEGQPNGIYFYSIRFENMMHTGKLILNR